MTEVNQQPAPETQESAQEPIRATETKEIPPPQAITDPQAETAGKVTAALTQTPAVDNKERSPEEVDAMFKDPSRTFLVVEDNIEESWGIVNGLNKKRGEQKSENVLLAESTEEATQAAERILQNPKIKTITLILDMEFPVRKHGAPNPRGGMNALKLIKSMVEKRNTESPENPITLEVIANSSMIRSQKEAEKELGTKTFSPKKELAVQTVENFFANK